MTKKTTPDNRLGNLLQEAREKREMTLGDVAGITHVRKEYLQAIDEGRWQDLPENVYTRNFLRLYASAVGIEEAAVLNLYGEERYGQRNSRKNRVNRRANSDRSSTQNVVNSVEPARGYAHYQNPTDYAQSSTPPVQRPRRSGRWMVPFLLFVTFAAGGIYVWQNMSYTDILTQAKQWYAQQTWLPWLDDAEADASLVNVADMSGGDLEAEVPELPEVSEVPQVSSPVSAVTSSEVSSSVAIEASTTNTNTIEDAVASSDDSVDNFTSTSTQAAFAQDEPDTLALDVAETGLTDEVSLVSGGVASGDLPPENDQVLLSITTDPAGANVSLDGFALYSPTPIIAASVTPGRSRVLTLELDGYEPIEQDIDLTLDREIVYVFTPLETNLPEGDAATNEEQIVDTEAASEEQVITVSSEESTESVAVEDTDDTAGSVVLAADVDTNSVDQNLDNASDEALLTPVADVAETQQEDQADENASNLDADVQLGEDSQGLVLTSSERVWLEVYTGTSRGDGERLVYRMVTPGERVVVALPAFVHAGNSQALQVSLNGENLGAHGEDVTGKLYQ